MNTVPLRCGVSPLVWLLSLFGSAEAMSAAETVGERPYEMVWAGRTNDTRPPLIDFEQLDGWTAITNDALATFTRSREQQLWGNGVGKLAYRASGKTPRVTIQPPQPVRVTPPFDCVSLWLYGNNWGWAPEPGTPPVEVTILLRNRAGVPVPVRLGSVRWKEWFLIHHKLSPAQAKLVLDGANFEGIQIANAKNKADRVIYFDNLAFYREELPALTFEPRRQRGVDPFRGQSPGNNTGPGRLSFPTREETILPDNLPKDFTTGIARDGSAFVFSYRGSDGQLDYRYEPKTGTLGDVTARWDGRGGWFQPMAAGGLFFVGKESSKLTPADKAELLHCEQVGDTVISQWRAQLGAHPVEFAWTFRLWQKSLVVDARCLGGDVGEFQIGKAEGLDNPRLVTLPYLSFLSTRPAVVVSGPPDRQLFLFALLDYYRSNGSELWSRNEVRTDGVAYNGGSRYRPKTDGQRNDCFERLFLTVSKQFEEVLPNIPNPKSPWMHVAGERLWIAHGASSRTNDYAHWKNVARYGMTNIVITDHETGWRDSGESFTFRTRAAPGKGGDEGQAEYARKIRALGFRYGIYNNYTDFAPVNEHWHEDMVTRLPDGQWQPAWPRCYNPKPARAVEFEARLAPMIQSKFHLDTAYCDVHTAVAPWSYVDYDARVPGAGTFTATLYAYGEIMLHQKATWNGPVYSEGNRHWYYCGLTDGNYAQDQSARLPVNPWLVDFDLRKLHPLGCNFGMGNWEMFYGSDVPRGATLEEKEVMFDRFLAATLAFGHTGFFMSNPAHPDHGARSYFLVQQVAANYAQQTAAEVMYADAHGLLFPTSEAVAGGAFRRSQVATRYSNGLRVLVNGHPTETWKVAQAELPPNGWWAGRDDGKLVAFSAQVDGHRADYVASPAYLYADGRGRFTRFDKVASDGQVIAHRLAGGAMEVIPVGRCSSFGVSLGGQLGTTTALDPERKNLGPVETRLSRGLVYVMPVSNAFSYLVTPGARPAVALRCEHERVVPGQAVEVTGHSLHRFTVPKTAQPGSRLWQQFENAWIDFTVMPLADVTLSLTDRLVLEIKSHAPETVTAQISLGGQVQSAGLLPDRVTQVQFPVSKPDQEFVRPLPLRITAGEFVHEQAWALKALRGLRPVVAWPDKFQGGQGLRGQRETDLDPASGAIAHPESMLCGDVTRSGLFLHPPYQKGVGYSFALHDAVTLPREPQAVFRCEIGKRDTSDRGDGILFRVAVVESNGQETVVAEKQWAEHAWTPLEADLSRWAGQTIRIKLIADVGPTDNSSGDWSCWAGMRIETKDPELVLSLHTNGVRFRREPAPFPLPGLTQADLRAAKAGWLRYDGKGLEGAGRFATQGFLNGVALGDLAPAHGDEGKGQFTEKAGVRLTPEAIRSLSVRNRFGVKNPNQDCFSLRRFWIELELADGRRCSSEISAITLSQPPGWSHAEGVGLPFSEDIEVDVWFAPLR